MRVGANQKPEDVRRVEAGKNLVPEQVSPLGEERGVALNAIKNVCGLLDKFHLYFRQESLDFGLS